MMIFVKLLMDIDFLLFRNIPETYPDSGQNPTLSAI